MIHLKINKQVLPLFRFLADNPTQAIAKGNHIIMFYYAPPKSFIMPFSYKGITVSIKDGDNLESYLSDGWKIVRGNNIALAQNKLLDVINDLETSQLKQRRAGTPVAINGEVFNWISYGLNNLEDVDKFVKLFYICGYSYDEIVQLYTSLVKNMKGHERFLKIINTLFKEDLNA